MSVFVALFMELDNLKLFSPVDASYEHNFLFRII